MPTRLANSTARAANDAITALADNGRLEIRTGAQPADGDTTPTGTILATFTLPATAFAASVDANPHADATANAITDVNGSATGEAGYYIVRDSSLAVRWMGNITVTGGGGELTLADLTITSGQPVAVTSWTFRHLEL